MSALPPEPEGQKKIMRLRPSTALILLSLTGSQLALAEPHPAYYGTVNLNSPEAMRQSLHEVIDDHARFPLSATETDVWDILELADENIDNSAQVISIFRNASFTKAGPDNEDYVPLHIWPPAYGYIINEPDNYPFTDAHQIFIGVSGYGEDYPYSYCNQFCTEKPTVANNGRGGIGGSYPSDSNWRTVRGANGLYEIWNGRRGDVARALFYTDLRYEGGTHGTTGASEPDLVLSDEQVLIDRSKRGENLDTAWFGDLSTLINWHRDDPVDDIERMRNETVASFQGNRNPFIDHPEWVACIFQNMCTPFEINAGITGTWFNPATPGQGFFVTVFPSLKLPACAATGAMFVAMFTYEVERPDESVTAIMGEPGHRWITALGCLDGSTATLEIEQTSGGVFNEPLPKVNQEPDGTLTIVFGGCDNATATYDIPSIGRVGDIPLTRVVKDNVAYCESLAAAE
jgi:hypothetical protein